MRALSRFFFMHLGSFVAVITYFVLCGAGAYAAPAVQSALLTALVVHSAYMALAAAAGELKQFDFGIGIMFALGTLGTRLSPDALLPIFQRYSGVILFITLALTALGPLLLGRETFTYYYARRQTPAWQQKLPEFPRLNRFMTVYSALLFTIAAGLVAWAPRDWHFSFLYPNLVCFGLGVTSPLWLIPLYMKWNPPALPTTIEPLLLGMPFVFDRKAAGTTRASIQFHVSGADAGDYVLRITNGRCESFTGTIPAPDVTVHTPDNVWVRIAHGELDGTRALRRGLYRADDDSMLLMRLNDWFPTRR